MFAVSATQCPHPLLLYMTGCSLYTGRSLTAASGGLQHDLLNCCPSYFLLAAVQHLLIVLYIADDLSGQASTQILSILQFVGGATVQQPEYVNELSSGCRQSLRVCLCPCIKGPFE